MNDQQKNKEQIAKNNKVEVIRKGCSANKSSPNTGCWIVARSDRAIKINAALKVRKNKSKHFM